MFEDIQDAAGHANSSTTGPYDARGYDPERSGSLFLDYSRASQAPICGGGSMAIRIPISARARKYGYIIWAKKQDEDVRKLLPNQEGVTVVFEDSDLGKKRVDWKYRRISVGPSQTRRLDLRASSFELSSPADGRLEVKCL